MNAHAAQILAACGRASASPRAPRRSFRRCGLLTPTIYGGPDVNEITGGEGTFPHVTQSETQTWAQGNTVVTAYNDSRSAPSCYSGGSYSTDNGVTFTNLNTRPFCSGHGTGFGDPVVVYDQAHAKWIAVFLASGCGGQGIGVWTSTDGMHLGARPLRAQRRQRRPRVGYRRQQPVEPALRPRCTSPGTTSTSARAPSQVIHSDDGGATWSAPVDRLQRATSSATSRSQSARTAPSSSPAWTRGGGGLGNRRTSSTAPLTAARPGTRRTRALRSQAPASRRAATSPRCSRPTGGTWAGATSPPARAGSSTTSTPSTARAPTSATSTTSARPTTE